MRSKVTIHLLFSRRAQDKLDKRIANGYEKASRQAAGGGEQRHPQTTLEGIPIAQEKTISPLAAPEAFTSKTRSVLSA